MLSFFLRAQDGPLKDVKRTFGVYLHYIILYFKQGYTPVINL